MRQRMREMWRTNCAQGAGQSARRDREQDQTGFQEDAR